MELNHKTRLVCYHVELCHRHQMFGWNGWPKPISNWNIFVVPAIVDLGKKRADPTTPSISLGEKKEEKKNRDLYGFSILILTS